MRNNMKGTRTMDLNFADLQDIAKEAGFATVPPGTYHVEVERAEHTMTSTDKVMFKVMYRLIPGMNGEVKGTVWNNFVVSPENAMALMFFFRHMEAMGLPKSFFTNQTSNNQVCDTLVGRQCRIKVVHEPWNDQMQAKVKSVLAPVAGPGTAPARAATVGPAAQPGPAPAAAAPAPATVAVNGGSPGPAPAPAAAQPAAQPAATEPAPAAPSF